MDAILRFRWWMAPALLLVACEQTELPIDPFDRGNVTTVEVAMGANYETQVWYDLGNQEVVSTNSRFDWDLAFGCADSVERIWLNTSLVMMASPTGSNDFTAVTEDVGLEYAPDHPSGNMDSMAFAGWKGDEEVWLIDLGYTVDGTSRGKRKVQISVNENKEYVLRYAELSGAGEKTVIVGKDDRFNWLAFSFKTENTLEIEPPKEQYDLCFTTYTNVFYDPYLPYSVSGVLLNSYRTNALRDIEHPFTALNLSLVAQSDFSNQSNTIGYDWKYYDLGESAFTVFPEINFIVTDSEGFFYKLHFLDFYNNNGIKGHPLMELQRI